ncbi:MAG: ankyrin repeat domain-containing protein [Leptospirales bacterium]|nr:ankyrin repeat domain-containing protein [Leptospirales bacterium]
MRFAFRILALSSFALASGPAEADSVASAMAARAQKYSVPVPGGHYVGKNDPTYTYSMSDGYLTKPILVVCKSGQRFLAYNDSDWNGRIVLLDNNFKVQKEIVRLSNKRIQDMIADEDSVVALLAEFTPKRENGYVDREIHTAHIEKYNLTGGKIFSTRIVGTLEYKKEGDQGISSSFAAFNISKGKTQYATYFTTYRRWRDGITHQSEYLALFDRSSGKLEMDPENKKYALGFTWNVSHSFRPRFVFDGERFVMAKVGDAYPRGFVVESFPRQKQNMVVAVPPAAQGETYQEVAVSTGDLYGRNGNAWVVFDSAIGRSSYDIGLVRVQGGNVGAPIWLTNSSGIRERIPRITAYGKNFLIIWGVDTGKQKWYPANADIQLQAAMIGESGNLISAPANFGGKGEFKMRGDARFFEIPEAGIGWVNDHTGDASKLEIVFIPYDGVQPPQNTNQTTEIDQPSINADLNYPLLDAIYEGQESDAIRLLSQGADPNAKHGEWTALLYAANFGRTSVVKELLKRKADPNATVSGWTALKLAESGSFEEIVSMLKPITTARARNMTPISPTRPATQSTRSERSIREDLKLLGPGIKRRPD